MNKELNQQLEETQGNNSRQPETEIAESPPTNLIDMHLAVESKRAETPLNWLWWTGATTLAAACGRQVYTKLTGSHSPPMYPNLFTLLVGPGNMGKTTAILFAKKRLDLLRIKYAPDTITGSKLITWASQSSMASLDEGLDPGIVIALPNLDSQFSKSTPAEFKSFLIAGFDNANRYRKDTQSRGKEQIHNMCINLLAAGTPSHLASCFTSSDWAEGLASKFIVVYDDSNRRAEFLNPPPFPSELEAEFEGRLVDLKSGLQRNPIELGWTDEARLARFNWRNAQDSTTPPHPSAAGCWKRRDTIAVKLAMLLAVAEGETTIHLDQWDRAICELQKLEPGLPEAFFHTGQNPYLASMESVVAWVKKQNRTIQEHELRKKLLPHVAPQHAEQLLNQLFTSRQLIATGTPPTREIIHPEFQQKSNAEKGVISWSDIQRSKAQAA